MGTLEAVLLVLLIVDALALTVLVLLQQGKGADVGAAFGSGTSNTMFGSAGGASFMTKVTTWLAVGFLLSHLASPIRRKSEQRQPDKLVFPKLQCHRKCRR